MSLASSSANPMAAATKAPARRSRLGILFELTKARLSGLVVFTTAAGFVLGSRGSVDWVTMLWAAVGTALAAGAASIFNQVIEVPRDRLMHRTRHRPIPSGVMGPKRSFVFAVLMGYAGITILAVLVNLVAAGLALLTIVIYVALYTPLKVRSTLNTLVGAVVGAIPPMIGWVGARGTLDTGAWALAAILFIWQIPHFLALAWRYREDYARGGFAMLPVIDETGRLTSQVVVFSSLALVPIGLTAALAGVAGGIYALGSAALGIWMSVLAVRLYMDRTDARARGVFLASLVYLPVMLSLMMIDRGPIGGHVVAVPAMVAAEPTMVLAAPFSPQG